MKTHRMIGISSTNDFRSIENLDIVVISFSKKKIFESGGVERETEFFFMCAHEFLKSDDDIEMWWLWVVVESVVETEFWIFSLIHLSQIVLK